jgi:rod shape-determining protein MreD
MYNPIQQSGLLLVLSLVALGLGHWLRVISGQIEPVDSMYLLAAFSSAAIWPALFSVLRSIRRGFINN